MTTQTLARVFSPSATYYECGICDQWHALEWDGDCRQDSARLNPEDMDEKHGAFDWTAIDMAEVDNVRASRWAHTPGPWLYQPSAGDHDFLIYDEASGRDVALVRDFNEPNAKLVTAAPELAAALRDVREWLMTGEVDGVKFDEASVITEVDSVLRKAGVL